MTSDAPMHPPGRRPVVTGMGVVTSLGIGIEETWRALRSGARTIATPGSAEGLPQRIRIRDFEPRPFFHSPKSVKLTDRKTQLAVVAAELAMRDAGISEDDPRDDLAVILGCCSSDLDTDGLARALARSEADVVTSIPAFAEAILKGLNPLWLLVNLPNMVSAHVAIQQRSNGPNWTVMTDWIAGLQAIGEAAAGIASGELEWALAGGADCGTPPFFVACYSQDAPLARPSRGRPGLVLSEGAAILLLESEERAVARGARILGSVEGFASRAADEEGGCTTGLRAATNDALADAGWTRAQLTLVCRAAVDRGRFLDEEQALLVELGKDLERPPCTMEVRSALGLALGASGAIDAALVLRALAERPDGGRGLCSALGCEGQAAVLAAAAPPLTREERV